MSPCGATRSAPGQDAYPRFLGKPPAKRPRARRALTQRCDEAALTSAPSRRTPRGRSSRDRQGHAGVAELRLEGRPGAVTSAGPRGSRWAAAPQLNFFGVALWDSCARRDLGSRRGAPCGACPSGSSPAGDLCVTLGRRLRQGRAAPAASPRPHPTLSQRERGKTPAPPGSGREGRPAGARAPVGARPLSNLPQRGRGRRDPPLGELG